MAKTHRTLPRHKLGDRVRIIRHEHGWVDGREEGTVVEVLPTETGRVGYTVQTDNGGFYSCRNTRDLRTPLP